MSNPLDGAHAKLARADMHLSTLEDEVGDYLATGPVSVEERLEEDGEIRHIRWVATANSEPPDMLGLIIGDWANNVRAALDYTVYELVRRETGTGDPRWTQFPVATHPSKYPEQAAARLRGVPSWSLPVFEGLQPFNDGDEAEFHYLAVLADVSNRDKHRLVHTTAMQIAGSQARVEGVGMKAIYQLAQDPGSVSGERVILDAVIAVESNDYRIGLEMEVSVALEGYEVPIVGLLRWITDEARDIVEWFKPALA
jgi:hypothetical protein